MTKLIYVRARAGLRVPREGAPRRHITATRAVRVAASAYYRRQIRDGDLVVVDPSTDTDTATDTQES